MEAYELWHMGPKEDPCPGCGATFHNAPWLGKGATELIHDENCPYLAWEDAVEAASLKEDEQEAASQ